MKAFVDQDICIGCGLCAETVPQVFKMNDDGKAEAFAQTTETNQDAVQTAIENCPVSAIREQE